MNNVDDKAGATVLFSYSASQHRKSLLLHPYELSSLAICRTAGGA